MHIRFFIADLTIALLLIGAESLYQLGIIPNSNDIVTITAVVTMLKVFYDIYHDRHDPDRDKQNKHTGDDDSPKRPV